MGKHQQTKGKTGEREVARLLREHLGIECRRSGLGFDGHDILGVDGYAIEVKRAKQYCNAWRIQAREQASAEIPVLIYRLDGFGRGLADEYKWTVETPGHGLIPALEGSEYWLSMPLAAWFQILREDL